MRLWTSDELQGSITVTTSTNTEQSGFVLVAVIWVLAAFALLATFIADEFEQAQRSAVANEKQKLVQLERLSIESTLQYLSATRGYSFAGLRTASFDDRPNQQGSLQDELFSPEGNEIRMDGRAYRVFESYLVRIQDAGSLVSLRPESAGDLRALLEHYELSRSEIDRLLSNLQDYVDRDDIPRLNGAEREEYVRQQLLPPTNRFLVSPGQLRNVLGWNEVLNRFPEILEQVTIYPANLRNYNTMTQFALEVFGQHDRGGVERLLSHRVDNAFISQTEVQSITGEVAPYDPLAMTLLPSRYLRAHIAELDSGNSWTLAITLTPDSNLSPWQVDYRQSQSLTTDNPNERLGRLAATAAPTALLR